MDNELTLNQANDLARYFLGPEWSATTGPEPGVYSLRSRRGPVLYHSSWRDVFRAAGVKLPSRSRFTAQGTSVMHDSETVATARSGNMAERIASALNKHTPNRRGI